MNFVLIPFFLAVNVPVDDPTEWNHGPVYVFQTNVTYQVFPDPVTERQQRVSEVLYLKCRPDSAQRLFCQFKELDSSNEESLREEDRATIDLPFLIEFSPRGIENLRFLYPMGKLDLYFIRSIVKQLSVGADLRENANTLSGFQAKENYVLGECTTSFKVAEREKTKNHPMKYRNQPLNYDIKILPLRETSPDKALFIEKKTESGKCVKPKDPDYRAENVDVESTAEMRISKDTFESRGELFVKRGQRNRKANLIHQDIISVELLLIEPAKRALPIFSFDHVVPLHFKRTIDHNFLS